MLHFWRGYGVKMNLKKLSTNVNEKTNVFFRRITILVCLIFGLTIVMITVKNKNAKNVESVKLYCSQIDTTMDEKISFIDTLATGVSSGAVKDDFYAYVDSMVALYDDVSAVYVCVQEEGTIYSDGIMTYMSGGWVPPEGFVVSERAWYQGAVNTDGVFVSEPYVDEQSGNICITLAKKVTRDGKVIGVAGLDMYMSDLVNLIEGSYKGNDYVFLVSDEGTILTHPDETIALTAQSSHTISDAYNGKYESVCSKDLAQRVIWDYKGGMKLAISTTSEYTGWKIVAVVSLANIVFIVIGNIVYALAIGFLISLLVKKKINKNIAPMFVPLEKLSNNVGKIAEGELSYQFDIDEQSEEVNELSRELNNTMSSLQGYIAQITQTVRMISEKNLNFDVDGEFEGDYRSIKEALTDIINVLNECFNSINEQARTVNEYSKNLASTSEYVAETATTQSGAVINASQEMNALTVNMEKIAQEALEIKANNDTTNSMLQSGTDEMERLVVAIGDIVNCYEEIAHLVTDINSIASQTNLLSLNASIEAARAGDVGRGFAVVAEEIGNLSKGSAESSAKINEVIGRSLQSVEKGKELVEKTRDIIRESANYASASTGKVEDIVCFVDEQKVSAKQISQNLVTISEMSESNAASAQENSAISTSLGDCADALMALIGEFNLKG